MRKIYLFALATIAFLWHHSADAQDFSNKGKEFWIGYGNHIRMMNSVPWPATECVRQGNNQVCPEKMELYITSDVSTQGKVEIPGIGFSQTYTVTANQITTIEIPRAAALPDEGTYNAGIHVTADKPVVVYSFIYVSAISGATLCLPVNTLGREYTSVNFDQVSNEPNSYSYFLVIATDPGTTRVEIVPSANTKGGLQANKPDTIALQQGQVHQVLSSTDLTGSTIRSINDGSGCKKIAVFSGASKIALGCNGSGTSDNLYQQVYPTSTWGKTYLFAPSVNSSNPSGQFNFIRVVKSDPNADVRVNGIVYPSSGQKYLTLPITNEPGIVESDKPIMVAQYFTTQACGGNSGPGDPDMIFLNPVEQTINKVTLNAMQPFVNTNINEHFINVYIKNDPSAFASFTIDGVNYGSSFVPHPTAPSYAYARIAVSQGTHNLYCDTPFNAIAYGFGNFESYGYSAGTNLKDLYQFVSIRNVFGTVSFPAGCKSSPLEFSMTFPYKPVSIAWKFNGLFNDTTLISPTPDSSWVVNGRTIYKYILKRPYQVDAVGTYPIKIIANNPTADGCAGEQEIEYDLQIFDQPQAIFQTAFSGCVADSMRFTDLSAASSTRPIIARFWDFGDGRKSSSANPVIKYSTGGKYNASLQVVTDIGCISTVTGKEITVANMPKADFLEQAPFCQYGEVKWNDLSQPLGTPIKTWYWDFGEGKIDSVQTTTPFNYSYSNTGQYQVKLYVRNTQGCLSDTVSRQLTIYPKPIGGFVLPEICLNDAFANFADSSKVADQSALTYAWNFGDGSNGTGKNAVHKYNASGIYDVTQYITSPQGCMDTTTQKFTVNGSNPISRFEVIGGNFCSNLLMSIRNKSIVDFGNVTRLVIQWDISDPSQQTIDEEPSPDKLYTHRYPVFRQPASRQVTILLTAYSGSVCQGQSTQVVQLLATPDAVLDPFTAVCDNAPSFQFTQGRDASGLVVSGQYSGAGVNAAGLFNPAVAGKGLHEIQYVTQSQGGCTDTAKAVIEVTESPKVNAGPDKVVLEGTSIPLDATATAVATKFLWSPDEGLNRTDVLKPQASPGRDILYTLSAETDRGCIGTDQVFVRYLPKLVVPNTFTPNGDGYNDVWEIKGLNVYLGCIIEVYNTAGSLLFRSTGYGQPWDGTYRGQQVPAGTYYYVIDPKNGRPKLAGYVTILR
jgi:gliding motility-associated-like protein